MCLVLGEVEKMSKRMLEVEEAKIQVVPESFLQESMAGNAIENITSLNIAGWGSDVSYKVTNEMFLHTVKHSCLTLTVVVHGQNTNNSDNQRQKNPLINSTSSRLKTQTIYLYSVSIQRWYRMASNKLNINMHLQY